MRIEKFRAHSRLQARYVESLISLPVLMKMEFHRLHKKVSETFTLSEAIKEAQRCLNYKVPGCNKGCPKRLDIPGINNLGVRQGIRFLRRVVCMKMDMY